MAAVAAMLAVYFSHVVTRRAIVDTPFQHVVYEVVTVALMVVIGCRSRLAWMSTPAVPSAFRAGYPLTRGATAAWACVATALTIIGTELARTTGLVVSVFRESSVDCDPNDAAACCSYNDPACSGDGAGVDLVEVFTAAIGEELAFRYALLVILSRVIGIRAAVAVQAVVFGLSHTGFDGGYGADLVVGLVAVGAVSAAAVVLTRSIWPAIAAHALHSSGVAAFDHDLTLISWAVNIVYAIAVLVSALAVAKVFVNWAVRRR